MAMNQLAKIVVAKKVALMFELCDDDCDGVLSVAELEDMLVRNE